MMCNAVQMKYNDVEGEEQQHRDIDDGRKEVDNFIQ